MRTEPNDGNNVLVRVDRLVSETPKALLVAMSSDGGEEEEVWIPKSQVASLDVDTGEVWLPLWLAEKKGLQYD